MKTILISATVIALSAGASFAAGPGGGQQGAHFIENWDLDGDGQVTLAEAQEKRGEIFYMFDQDENDLLDSAEYDRFDETRKADMEANAGGHGKGRMGQANKGMQRAFNDTDGDGAVSKAEFAQNSEAWFAMVDKSGDGIVTTDDFGRK